jgi:hypothetical protein
MKRTFVLAAALAAAASSTLGADSAPGDRTAREVGRPPMHERMRAAHQACQQVADRGACMRERMCADAADPARCRAEAEDRHKRMLSRMDERQAMHEACTGKRGEELLRCLGEQRRAQRGRNRG